MKSYIISTFLFVGSCITANAAGSSDDPVERMASGVLKVVVVVIIVGAVSFFKRNKNK